MANTLAADVRDGQAASQQHRGPAKMTQRGVWSNLLQRESSGSDFADTPPSSLASPSQTTAVTLDAGSENHAPATRRRVMAMTRNTNDATRSEPLRRPTRAPKNARRSQPTPKQTRKPQQATGARKKQGPKAPIGQRELRDLKQTSMLQHFKPRLTRRLSESAKKEQQLQEIQAMIREGRDSEDLEVVLFPDKGKGVLAGRVFEKGEYVCEYAGDLIEKTEADKREQQYLEEANRNQMDEMMCYMYFLKHKGKVWCVDATHSGRIGRLINHSRTQCNLRTKLFEVDGQPHLGFVTIRRLQKGEELLYDYGERDPRTLRAMPWLKK